MFSFYFKRLLGNREQEKGFSITMILLVLIDLLGLKK